MTTPAIAARAIHKSFRGTEVLRGVDLTVAPGEVVAVIGPSGSGKSTLLRVLNHLEAQDSGTVEADGELIGYRLRRGALHALSDRRVRAQRAHIGFVFQQFNLFPHLTALENIVFAPVSAQGRDRATVRAEALSLLECVGLKDFADAYPRRLSGGQQQRVAIARALALRPKVILFDEPTSALDPELVGEVLTVIATLAHQGTALVIVTHEIGFAREVADRVVFLDGGKVVETGTAAQVLDAPEHPRTRAFLARVH
ncbi:amino acid ABC transporter ATP-binding protein [Nocardia camponoti]|uniref:Amino acid ABC transporter, ATP-binding protein n=1 Tax=Nocardia camponoti TaxID=1616106 RepID=A0A917QSF7_9NOCA|nr:amino acid ABC transporter ATP-binding protein [Nocardia camponoti]GGK66180.1 putative amino acid ABC transporter, ATP-binding protein [Nocardia camponoti]